MPCPYAERRGSLVFCKILGKPVNPLVYPCLSNKYKSCKHYKEPVKAEEKKAPPAPKPETTPPSLTGVGVTKDGGIPRTCRECVFYSEHLGFCFLLNTKIEDPEKPLCLSRSREK